MAYSSKLWLTAKGFYESGLMPREISKRISDNPEFKKELNGKQLSHSKIGDKAKKEQWEQNKNLDYIKAQELIVAKKEQEKGTTEGNISLQCANEIASERISQMLAEQKLKSQAFRIAQKNLDYAEQVMKKQKISTVITKYKYVTDTETGEQIRTLDSETVEERDIDVREIGEGIDKTLLAVGINQRGNQIQVTNTINDNNGLYNNQKDIVQQAKEITALINSIEDVNNE